MASLGNLTYNITVNDEALKEIKEEIASLRATLLVQEAKLECQAEKFGKELGKHAAAKYQKMLAEQEAVDVARKANGKTLDEYMEEWKALISEATLVSLRPFVVQQGQVYINQAFLDEGVQSDNYKARTPGKADGSGWKLGAEADFELNSANTKVIIKDGVLKVFDNNNTLRTRVQL